MKILVACEYSGVVRDAFRKRGFDAWSCDILPTDADPTYHFQCDVFEVLDKGWDLMIAHPPCTYLANSGVQHLHKDESRWEKMYKGRDFFLALLNANIDKIAVENPVPHKYAKLPSYSQIVQPYYFGDNVQKKTCLWLKNLPFLVPTNVVDKGECYIGKDGKSNGSKWYQLPPSKDRWKLRSKTFQGIADAMAQQWGDYLIKENLTRANLTGADLTGANLTRADLTGANLTGADLDFSCLPLWCGSLKMKVDKRLACQIAYHLCSMQCDDEEYKSIRNSILGFANQFHRVDECGRLE